MFGTEQPVPAGADADHPPARSRSAARPPEPQSPPAPRPAWGTLPAVPTVRAAVAADIPRRRRALGPRRRARPATPAADDDAARLLARDPEALIVAVDDDGPSSARSSSAGTAGAPTCTDCASRRRPGAVASRTHAGRTPRLGAPRALGAVRLDAMVHAGNADAIGVLARRRVHASKATTGAGRCIPARRRPAAADRVTLLGRRDHRDRRHGRGHDQHRRRLGLADHLPDRC